MLRNTALAISLSLIVLWTSACTSSKVAKREAPKTINPIGSSTESIAQVKAQRHPAVASASLAERRLGRIYQKQLDTEDILRTYGDKFTSSERDRILNEVFTEYQSFTLDNQDYAYGFILYGKYMRSVGQNDQANIAFAEANRIDPKIAVVKQQIGNYLVEKADYELALAYFVAAVELEPEVAIYHYQLGELLANYREHFENEGQMPTDVLEGQLLESFRRAAELAPDERQLQLRYAEAFFDAPTQANWQEALLLWQSITKSSESDIEADVAQLQQVRVLMQLGQLEQAQLSVQQIKRPSLQLHKEQLLTEITQAQAQPKS